MITRLLERLSGLLIWVGLFFLQNPAFAGGVVASPTEGSLRAAMAGGGVVTFNCSGTIYLAGSLVISNQTALDGTGQSIAISGSNAVQIFVVYSGGALSLTNLTVADGFAAGPSYSNSPVPVAGWGGAVSNAGNLQAVGCVFSNNAAWSYTQADPYSAYFTLPGGFGGAVYNVGSASLSGCMFVNNTATGAHGAIDQFAPGYIDLTGGDGSGGALYSSSSAVIVNCVFSNNLATGGDGATLRGLDSGVSYNRGGPAGAGYGGACCNTGVILVSNCAFAANFSTGGAGGPGPAGLDEVYGGQRGYSGGCRGRGTAAHFASRTVLPRL
ncbi:MAG TPA: hypothetical protein VHB20_08855 [Verrucomicrobiae bacterium]|jgi:hypothetical protein|nr:hypothetical protein [Verrucomicrobiae bacterium]